MAHASAIFLKRCFFGYCKPLTNFQNLYKIDWHFLPMYSLVLCRNAFLEFPTHHFQWHHLQRTDSWRTSTFGSEVDEDERPKGARRAQSSPCPAEGRWRAQRPVRGSGSGSVPPSSSGQRAPEHAPRSLQRGFRGCSPGSSSGSVRPWSRQGVSDFPARERRGGGSGRRARPRTPPPAAPLGARAAAAASLI